MNALLRNLRLITYRFVLPAVTAYGLLVASPSMSRPRLGGSPTLDLWARVWLCFIYTAHFIVVGDYPRYERLIYGPFNGGSRGDVDTRFWRGMTGGLAFVLTAAITWVSVQAFLPTLAEYAWLLAIAYGIVAALPTVLLPRG